MGKHGVRLNPEKIKAIIDWAVPIDIKVILKFLGLEVYLHKYSHSYAEMNVHLSRLLKKTISGYGVPIVSAPSKVSSKA